MDDSVHNAALVDTFLVLQIFGAFAFAFIILSACIFRGVKREPVWFNFCISWLVYCVSYSLLVFVGQHRKQPARDWCVAQAALVYGSPLLAGTTTLGLVLHLLLKTFSALSLLPKNKQKPYPILMTFIIWLPWMIWIVVNITVLALGITHLNYIAMSDNGTYCVINDTVVPKMVAVSSIIIAVAILCAEVMIGTLLYRGRAIVDVLGQSLTMTIRIFTFTLLGIGGLFCGVLFTATSGRGVQFDVLISALPPCAAIIFGTQKDLLKGWMFWTWTRNRQPTVTPTKAPSTLTLTTFGDPQKFNEISPTAPSIPLMTPVLQTPNHTSSTTRAAVQTSFLHI